MSKKKKINWFLEIRNFLTSLLKRAVVKAALVRLALLVTPVGWQVWLATLIVEYAFDELAEPVINKAFRKVKFVYDSKTGEIKFEKLEEAENVEEHNDIVDDIFG